MLGVLLLLAAVAGAGLAGAAPRRLAGSPVPAVLVAAAPRVGDCVLADPRPDLMVDRTAPALPTVPAGDCAASRLPHVGEVVSVYRDGPLFPVDNLGVRPVPDVDACRPAADAYLGLDRIRPDTDFGQAATRSAVPWVPAAVGRVAVIGPDALQRRLGQQWVACVSYGRGSAFRTSVRGVFPGGVLPDSYAVCTAASPAPPRPAVPCGIPHGVEVIAVLPLTYRVPPADELATSCTALTQAVTGRRDVTAGGALAVGVTVTHFDVQGRPVPGYPASGADQPAEAACAVTATGGRRLVATLSGAGDAPLPLAR
ncbi:hypothetical protein GCM10011594_20120 [Nakamurella endophytica]|uniref:Septum formation-related domain-containing protein n=1 Tax=Nakamurella endophytica TaxID=1748367 RepID=A0A917SUW2_9ACTN|nr:hypothetical protein GCM10011594_20120 [Nakamurella endophytica]